jgi:hypothetical protein
LNTESIDFFLCERACKKRRAHGPLAHDAFGDGLAGRVSLRRICIGRICIRRICIGRIVHRVQSQHGRVAV